MLNKNKMRNNAELFESVVGEDLYQKLIYSILKSQSELIRMYKLPSRGGFIFYRNGYLVWSILGEYSSLDDIDEFLSRANKDDILYYAIKSLRRNNKFNTQELKKIDVDLGDDDCIEIRPIEMRSNVISLEEVSNPIKEVAKEEIELKEDKSFWRSLGIFLKKLLINLSNIMA